MPVNGEKGSPKTGSDENGERQSAIGAAAVRAAQGTAAGTRARVGASERCTGGSVYPKSIELAGATVGRGLKRPRGAAGRAPGGQSAPSRAAQSVRWLPRAACIAVVLRSGGWSRATACAVGAGRQERAARPGGGRPQARGVPRPRPHLLLPACGCAELMTTTTFRSQHCHRRRGRPGAALPVAARHTLRRAHACVAFAASECPLLGVQCFEAWWWLREAHTAHTGTVRLGRVHTAFLPWPAASLRLRPLTMHVQRQQSTHATRQ